MAPAPPSPSFSRNLVAIGKGLVFAGIAGVIIVFVCAIGAQLLGGS
jgi:hypothetical protein